MKKKLPNLLGAIVHDYFTDHLPRVRGTSPHTIHSYRDSLVLLLRFLSARHKRPIAELDLKALEPAGILAFLSHLEKERKNGVATRNVRLTAIHAFFRFVASRNPEHLGLAQQVLGIPFKRAPERAIDYLEREEIDAILKAIDRTTPQGTRDYALLATMFNTGARVQEIADLQASDFQLTKPFQVREEGALLSAVAANRCGLALFLEGAGSGFTVRDSRVSESPWRAPDSVRDPLHPRQVLCPCFAGCSESPQEAASPSQCEA
jgi:integrase/recombinase XerD